MSESRFMEEARSIAAGCWLDEENSKTMMDVSLAESVARRIAAWMETAAEYCNNAEYYRGLVIKCGEVFGEEARTADDGTIREDVLCAKVPELVQRLMEKSKN